MNIKFKDFLHLLRWANPPIGAIVAAGVLSIVSTIAGLIVPFLTKDVVDLVSAQSVNRHLFILLGIAFLIQAVTSGLSLYLLAYVGQLTVARLRKQLWNKILSLPIPFFDKQRTGETISRVTGDTGVIKDLISNHLVSFFSSLISIIGSVIILSYIDWQMTVILLIAIPFMVLFVRPMGRKIHLISKRLQDETAQLSGVLTGVLSEIRLVKSFNAERVESKNGETGIEHLFRYSMKEAKIYAVLSPIMQICMMAILVVIIGFGGIRVSSGVLTAGELVAFLLYLFKIMMPFSSLAQFYTATQKAMGATERIISILGHEEEKSEENREVASVHQPIRFEKISFSYPESGDVLRGLDLTIWPGRVTAIVGPSGAGKTTLFSLLERFYTPHEGRILLGQTPISSFSINSWRKHLGYVSQDSPMMAGTVRENICYGLEREVSEAELREASAQAYADEFINQLPNGYDTEIGERGIRLSGGQRQRIAIARALLRNPSILMLDEATSSLDSASEQFVQKALQHLMKDRTTLIIAHRLSTVVDADQIVVMERGKVTGQGSHEQLLEEHAVYRELAKHQLKEGAGV
ncbi:ABC transporter ATP-binding protein [Ammoniphilus sp. CFH 90114]|uniref:ABC transporter ATP-binding protein n=1 Tax=Ammoniphilus sp. CFH 90114 TaxID=2493665 RepID=UPI00100FAC7D|nr:ABC transporter ATP-binding protein [Ammoniphilus sp. CFH 90114]RXT15266.1 ABC transporter ATP-binding protein [Ammoniphilus sp. CFH 90114]